MVRRAAWGLLLLLILTTSLWAAGPRVRRSCLLGWDAVTTNSNASAIEDLAGYRVYTSTSPDISADGVSYVLEVNAATTEATCRQLGLIVDNQQYYVRVTAIDTQTPPNESVVSNELALVITPGQILMR